MDIFLYFTPSFSVNFCAGPNMDSDVVFHYNPRLEQGRVVSNDKQRGNWGPEEIDAHVPFQRDQNFEIRFKISQQGTRNKKQLSTKIRTEKRVAVQTY